MAKKLRMPRLRFPKFSRPTLSRRVRRIIVVTAALFAVGGGYAAFSSATTAQEPTDPAAVIREGEKLFNQSCISCHGVNAEGVNDRGPSLVGVGAAAVEFQVATGRMPLASQSAQGQRKPTAYTPEQIAQLMAYIQSLGGGPTVPKGNLRDMDEISKGGELFRVNCAACHGFAANGGALSSGKSAPSLSEATDREIYAAMVSGPENMPVFGDNQLTPDEKKALIAYVQTMQESKDPGGLGIGRSGPVPEGLVAFLVGVAGLMFVALWIAGKSKA